MHNFYLFLLALFTSTGGIFLSLKVTGQMESFLGGEKTIQVIASIVGTSIAFFLIYKTALT